MITTIDLREATPIQANWLIAKIEGHQWRYPWMLERDGYAPWKSAEDAWGNPHPEYAQDPSVMHPIIEREKIATMYHDEWEVPNWGAWVCAGDDRVEVMGETALIAAARCYVASKLGEIVEVPEALC